MIRRLIPLFLLLLIMIAAYLLGADKYLTFEALKQHREAVLAFVAQHALLSPLVFMLVYVAATALSLPGGAMLSMLGGFLFGQLMSMIYVVVAATVGAVAVFSIAKTAFGDLFKERMGSAMQKMQKGFNENAASYLLFLRLAPLFPFWLVNVAPAFFGVSYTTYLWTTFFGIIPGVFVFTGAGAGIASILDVEGELSLETLFTLEMKIAVSALALFALLPVMIKKFR